MTHEDLDVDDVLELCTEILEEIYELPSKAGEFADGTSETVLSIKEWIEEHQHFTEAQISALRNIQRGVRKWLSD